ncbi:EamA family transporter, partial [Salmonella enterica subsp. enterica serovar Infantis]
TMIRLLFAVMILVTFYFMHGDKIFSILKNRKYALSMLIFSVVGALTVQLTFQLKIEKYNPATATVLKYLSTNIIVAWYAL